VVTCDVVVVGGGPAGSATAIELARSGCEVVLVDKAVFPRDKCCGDGLTTGALRRLEHLGLDPDAVPSWQRVHECWVRSPSGRTVSFPFPAAPGTYAAVARRHELDVALLDTARAAGAKVYDGHGLRSASCSNDGVLLDVDGLEPLSARYAIGADGMWSTLRKSIGIAESGYLGEWHAFRQYLSASGPASRQQWVWFEPDLLPGYAWSFPLADGAVNVGFGIRRRPGQPTRSMAEIWRSLLDRPHLRTVLGPGAVPEGPHKAWPIPSRIGSTPLASSNGRVLFVGDAARATDPMTGEGIGQALETGQLAAEALLTAGPDRPQAAAARYRSQVERGLAVDHRLSGVLSRTLSRPAGARAAVRIAGGNDWTRRRFARWLFEDYPRAVLVTPARWQRPLLAGSPAYAGRV
jgi:geranylgeranyl reductase family protein